MYIGLALLTISIIVIGVIKLNKALQGRVKLCMSSDKPHATVVFFLKDVEDNLEWLVRRLMFLRYGSYETFEILLIDRGSRDKTLEIAALLQRDYPTVSLVKVAGSLVSVERLLRSSDSQVVFMEELTVQQDYNLIINRIRQILKKRPIRSWDQSPAEIETVGQYNFKRQNDTMK